MKPGPLSLLLWLAFLTAAQADVTIIQKVEGVGPVSEMTMRIKGDRARIDATPQMSTIVDSKSGETVTLMHDQKMIVRVSPEKMKAAMEMVNKFGTEAKGSPAPVKLTPTGKKETINGFETEEYVCDTDSFRARYWIATKLPDAGSIVRQLQSLQADAWKIGGGQMPDFRDFPGLPIKTEISAQGYNIVTTITSVKQDPLPETDFAPPGNYKEMQDITTDFSGSVQKLLKAHATPTATP